jgi:electron transfer flavoprotein beta subunit
VAEKLSIPQVTYVEEILGINGNTIKMKRRLERGVETVEAPLPCVVTVNGSAADCRPRNARAMMKFKHARTVTERQDSSEDYISMYHDRPYLDIPQWSVNDIETDVEQLGLSGSPTKVKKIENIVFQAKETRRIGTEDESINSFMKELIDNHTLG